MYNIISVSDITVTVEIDNIGVKQYNHSLNDMDRMKTDSPELYALMSEQWKNEPFIQDSVLKTLEEEKSDKLKEMEMSFNERISGSFKTSQGYQMQFNVSDSIKMQGAITLMESVQAQYGYITQANDETIYDVPIEIMKVVFIEMLNAYAQCHARKQELRAFINNTQTKEELDEIIISWPV